VSGWGAGYPGVPSEAAQKAKAEAAAKDAEPKGEDSGAEASEGEGA
jgi:hypothetical protein